MRGIWGCTKGAGVTIEISGIIIMFSKYHKVNHKYSTITACYM